VPPQIPRYSCAHDSTVRHVRAEKKAPKGQLRSARWATGEPNSRESTQSKETTM